MIEVGEYVRTETGFIRRIKSVDKTEATEKCPVNMYWCNLDKPIKINKDIKRMFKRYNICDRNERCPKVKTF